MLLCLLLSPMNSKLRTKAAAASKALSPYLPREGNEGRAAVDASREISRLSVRHSRATDRDFHEAMKSDDDAVEDRMMRLIVSMSVSIGGALRGSKLLVRVVIGV